jgi:excisionase family DNA binding protein
MGEVKQIMKVEFDLEELEAIIDKKVQEKYNSLKESWETEFMTGKEVCAFLNISRPTLLNLRKLGKVKYKLFGREIRYKRSDLLNINE